MYEYEIAARVLPDYDITATDVSEIEMEVESGQLYPDYSGPYSVDAAMYDQTLATHYKNMTGDIVVNAVEEVNGVVTLPTADGEAKYIDITDKSGSIISQYHAKEDFSVGIKAIQAGNGDPSPSNIRPISGWTGATLYSTGINLFDGVIESGLINVSTGQNANDANSYRSKNYIPVSPNTTYYFKNSIHAETGEIGARYCCYDASKAFISSPSGASASRVFTTPENCYFIRFFIREPLSNADGTVAINYPSTDTAYHAYQGNTYNIDWTDEAGTVYIANLDVTLGKLRVTHVMVECDGSEDWNGIGVGGSSQRFTHVTGLSLVANELLSNEFVKAYINTGTFGNVRIFADGTISVLDSGKQFADATAFRTWLGSYPAQFLLMLATPLEYDLTPTEIQLLIGQNNIWADCGDITVTWGVQ